MMNYIKRLFIIIINTAVVYVTFQFAGCAKETKKEDYIARVNQSYLTRESLNSLVDTSGLTKAEQDEIIKNWIYNEILFQEAESKGITARDDFSRILSSSKRQLASALLLQEYGTSQSIDYSEDDLRNYFNKNKNSFKLNRNSYLINKVYFDNENDAIKFRELAINENWQNAVRTFVKDSLIRRNYDFVMLEQEDIYPWDLAAIIKDLYPNEISIVIAEKPGYYSLVQLLQSYPKDSVPPFEALKNVIRNRFIAEKKNQLINEYLKDLYSENEVEIKNEK